MSDISLSRSIPPYDVGIGNRALEPRRALEALVRGGRSRPLLLGLVVWLIGTVASVTLLKPFDVLEYSRYAHGALQAPLFHHLPREYPAPALVLFMAPLLLPGVPYAVGFALVMGIVLGVLVASFGPSQGPSAEEDPPSRLVAYLAVGTIMVIAGRYDLAAAAAAFWATRCATRGQWSRAWSWCTVGVLLKLFPAALWPVLLVGEWRAERKVPLRRLWWVAASTIGVLAVPLLRDRGAIFDTIHYYVHRPVEFGSVAAGLSLVFDWSGTHWVEQFRSTGIVNAAVGPMSTGIEVVAVAGCVAVWWLQRQGRLSLQSSALATLTLVVLGSKVGSVQYLMWLIPLWALYRFRRMWLAGAAIGTAVFPYAGWAERLHYGSNKPFAASLTLVFLARDLLVAWGTWRWLRSEIRPLTPPEPAYRELRTPPP